MRLPSYRGCLSCSLLWRQIECIQIPLPEASQDTEIPSELMPHFCQLMQREPQPLGWLQKEAAASRKDHRHMVCRCLCGMQLGIFNHSSWVDALAMLWLFAPSGVSRASNATIPVVGTCIQPFQNIYIPDARLAKVPGQANGPAKASTTANGVVSSQDKTFSQLIKERQAPQDPALYPHCGLGVSAMTGGSSCDAHCTTLPADLPAQLLLRPPLQQQVCCFIAAHCMTRDLTIHRYCRAGQCCRFFRASAWTRQSFQELAQ